MRPMRSAGKASWEGDATVERFAVMSDQFAAKPETADPLEQNRSPHALREARGVAEAKAGITHSVVAYPIKNSQT